MKPGVKGQKSPAVKQVLCFFKRPAVKGPVSSDEQTRRKRDFDRFPIEFQIGVSFEGKGGQTLYDEAELHDISGNGAMFITRTPQWYHPGQVLRMTIFLAGTQDVRASIRVEASVIRVHPFEGADGGIVRSESGIAVRFETPFEFERMTGPLEGDV